MAISLIPSIFGTRFEVLLLKGSRDCLAAGRNIRKVTGCNGLEQNIAQGSGLYRSGNYLPLASVSGKLRKQAVAAAAAHNTDRFQMFARQCLQVLQRLAVIQRQTFQTAANHCTRITGFRLTCPVAKLPNGCGHIHGVEKVSGIRIDQALERLGLLGQG